MNNRCCSGCKARRQRAKKWVCERKHGRRTVITGCWTRLCISAGGPRTSWRARLVQFIQRARSLPSNGWWLQVRCFTPRGGVGGFHGVPYSKRWSVRNRVPRVARLDSLYCTRNWPSARLDSLYPQGIANFCFAAIGGEVSSVWTQALLPAACVWRCIEYPVHQGTSGLPKMETHAWLPLMRQVRRLFVAGN